MPRFGPASHERLLTCDERLILVCNDVIRWFDFTVLWGARGEAEQNEAFRLGNSTKKWPNSKHNCAGPPYKSQAIDIAPWHAAAPHIRWDAEREFVLLAGFMLMAACDRKIGLRWGGDWDEDHDLYDVNKPFDLGHFELEPFRLRA